MRRLAHLHLGGDLRLPETYLYAGRSSGSESAVPEIRTHHVDRQGTRGDGEGVEAGKERRRERERERERDEHTYRDRPWTRGS